MPSEYKSILFCIVVLVSTSFSLDLKARENISFFQKAYQRVKKEIDQCIACIKGECSAQQRNKVLKNLTITVGALIALVAGGAAVKFKFFKPSRSTLLVNAIESMDAKDESHFDLIDDDGFKFILSASKATHDSITLEISLEGEELILPSLVEQTIDQLKKNKNINYIYYSVKHGNRLFVKEFTRETGTLEGWSSRCFY